MQNNSHKTNRSKVLLENTDQTWSEDSIRYINTPTANLEKFALYVQEAGYFRTFPPYYTERKNLNSFLVIYTLSGQGILDYLGHKYVLGPASLVFIDCNEYHHYKCEFQEGWEFYWVHFNGSTALGYFREFIKYDFEVLYDLQEEGLEKFMVDILEHTQKHDYASELQVSCDLISLLTRILIIANSKRLNRPTISPLINNALHYLEQHFAEAVSLDELASQCGFSKYYFAREFKKATGTSPNEYLILLRLNRAKELLRYTDYSVDDISFACGFQSTSHFIQLFKKRELDTPLQFRKRWSSSL